MIISKLYIKNFRGYTEQTIELHENLNVIIGKNDVGKSTILEGLEIFFNNNDSVKIDLLDLNKKRLDESNKEIIIQVSFKIDPSKSYTVDTIPTKLSREYLLDSEGYFTIRKVWNAGGQNITSKSLKTFIVANYPKEFDVPLTSKKIKDLRQDLANFNQTHDTESVNKTISSEIRQAIYNFSNIQQESLIETLIPIDAEDGKKIYEAIKVDLPLYFLFKSDRENKDSDSEVQGPLKVITKSILSGMQEELDTLKAKVIAATEDVGQRTIEKLREMNPEIANQLVPTVSTKAWESLFSFNFEDEDGIPINKRGSGVRRLILLNYFRAEAERQRNSEKTIIYALEEPETAQHPDWQRMLYNSLVELSEKQNTQILLTTHSPSLGALVPTSNIIYIYRENNELKIESNDPIILDKITQSLGVVPNISINKVSSEIKLIICVEGYTDIEFLKNVGNSCFNFNIDNPSILILPLGGGNLEHWENYKYLDKLSNIPQFHIYDRDVKKYKKIINRINQNSSHRALQTSFYEIENYIHPSLYNNCYNFSVPFINSETNNWKESWKDQNIPMNLNQHLKQCYENGDRHLKDYSQNEIKKKLNLELAKHLTIDLLKDINAHDEISEWFEYIKLNTLDTSNT